MLSWPVSGAPSGWPLSASQSRTVLSELAEARRLPSGLKATLHHDVFMAHERCAERLAALGIPEPHGLVIARRGEALAVGAERDAFTRALMPHERCAERLAALGIPEPHGLVPTRRGEALAVGAEGDARHDVSHGP